MALLEVKKLTKNFGKLSAVSELDFDVVEGEIHGLIGPNGAGKTTVFNLITGFYHPISGKIIFDGENVTNLDPHIVAKMGIIRSFQQTILFMQSTVLENVLIGFHMSCQAGPIKECLHTSKARNYDKYCRDRAMEIIEFMGLGDLKNEFAGNLPHGHQRTLGVSIALACHPKLLLLDEPVTGMNPTEIATMVERIRSIREKGVTIILVEHSMRVVMNVCDRITVMSYGKRIAEGSPPEVRQNPEVIEAYLGKEEC